MPRFKVRRNREAAMQYLRSLLLSLALVSALATSAGAVPPSYLLLRRAETPAPHGVPGKPPAYMQPVHGYGYAYGWFGATPRVHSARQFGYYREYTEWSFR
jgi:hypothetical protein